MMAGKSAASTIRKPTAPRKAAPIRSRAISAGCAAWCQASITTSARVTCTSTPLRPLGWKITAALITGGLSIWPWGWRWRTPSAGLGRDIGRGTHKEPFMFSKFINSLWIRLLGKVGVDFPGQWRFAKGKAGSALTLPALDGNQPLRVSWCDHGTQHSCKPTFVSRDSQGPTRKSKRNG